MDCREVAVSGGSTAMPKIVKTQNNTPTCTPQYKSEPTMYSPTPRNPTLSSMGTEALPVRGSHVACLNFKTSCVSVYKCLSLIVGFAIVTFHFTRCRYFLGHVACQNLRWQGLGTDIISQQ